MVGMTLVTIQYKEVDKRNVKDEVTKKITQQEFVKNLENYSFHICAEHAPAFMEVVQKFFDDRKK